MRYTENTHQKQQQPQTKLGLETSAVGPFWICDLWKAPSSSEPKSVTCMRMGHTQVSAKVSSCSHSNPSVIFWSGPVQIPLSENTAPEKCPGQV